VDDPYYVLGLEPGVEPERIGQAYRTLVRRYPPEMNPERFARIQGAYDLLRSYERWMEEAHRQASSLLEKLFPPPRLALKPLGPDPEPLQPDDLEPLVRPWRQAALKKALQEGMRDL
jgi:curved DNA-binding protein CbpA